VCVIGCLQSVGIFIRSPSKDEQSNESHPSTENGLEPTEQVEEDQDKQEVTEETKPVKRQVHTIHTPYRWNWESFQTKITF
jgi:hypothetical protein